MSRQTCAGEAPVTLLCETFGISRAAFYAARKPRLLARPERPSRPTRPGYSSAEEVLAAIHEVISREGAQAWGVRMVWATLKREGRRVSRKRVWAIMRAHGLVLARDSEPGEPARGHVAVPDPNRRLASDLTTTWTKQDGTAAITLCIDCGCRSLLGWSVTKEQEAAFVLAPIEQALLEAFGSPKNVPDGLELRTDHGPQYTGSDCAALCEWWHLEHTYAPVGRPTGNAVVERVIRTLKEEVVWLRDWESIEELRVAVAAWVRRYNEQRPHQALGYKTPSEYRAEKLGFAVYQAAA